MILDLLSAIYLWIRNHPLFTHLCLVAILSIALSTLFVLTKDGATKDKPPLSATVVVEYVVEIEALKARCSITEANILALAEAINRVAVAIDKVQTPPSLGNLATKGELELLRLEVATLKKELDNIGIIHSRSSSTFNMWLDEVKQSLEELEEELTAHTDNTTIHKQEAK